MNQQNNTHNQGDIATTLTIFAALVMTIGVIIGSVVVSSPQLTSLFTQAQSAQIEAVQGNNHEVSYTGITTRSIGNQKLIGGSICFKGGEPPSSGTYRVEVEMVTSGRNTNIGAAVTETFSGNSGISCPNSAPFNAAVISELPTGTSISDVQRIEIYVVPGNGGWEMSKTLIGRIGDPTAIFNVPPTQTPTDVPTAAPTPTPQACPELTGKVDQAKIDEALANPATVAGWGAPDPSGNPRTKLSITHLDQQYHELYNKLLYKVACAIEPSATPTPVPTDTPIPTQTPVPTHTPTPNPNATNTPTPAETRGARAEKTFLIINESSSLSIVEVSLELCIYNQSNTEECKTSRHDVNIPPYNPRNSLANRQYVTFNWQFNMLKNDIKNWKWGEYSEKLSNSTSNSAEIGTSIDDPDSVIGTITGGTETIETKIETEFQAAEISGDSCVNSADAALITTRIGEESTVATCEQYDVDCNGIFNTFDLAYIIEHLNEGDGCVYNQQ